MKKYFESFNVLIPTWFICIFMVTWDMGITLIIGIALIIIQHMQIKKIRNTSITRKSEEQNYSDDAFAPMGRRNLILTAGKYVGARDIPVGVYNIKILSGDGTVDLANTNKDYDKYVYIRLCMPGKSYGGRNTFPSSYNGLEIYDTSIITINESAKIEFIFSQEINAAKNESGNIKDESKIVGEVEKYEELDFDYDSMDGWKFEEFCAKLLERIGYNDVTVTSGSGDFGADIIAHKDKNKYAIQCKNYNGKVGNKAVQEVFSAKAYYGADIAVVITNSYFTEHAIEHARGTDVVLWDRDILNSMIEKANLLVVTNLKISKKRNKMKFKRYYTIKKKEFFRLGVI